METLLPCMFSDGVEEIVFVEVIFRYKRWQPLSEISTKRNFIIHACEWSKNVIGITLHSKVQC
jgi:hypothetical protein